MDGLWRIYSGTYGEEIAYYPDDAEYSHSVFGVGCSSGKSYTITFDEEGNIEDIEQNEE